MAIGISVQSALIQYTFPWVWGEAQTAYADSPYGVAPVDNHTSRFIWWLTELKNQHEDTEYPTSCGPKRYNYIHTHTNLSPHSESFPL